MGSMPRCVFDALGWNASAVPPLEICCLFFSGIVSARAGLQGVDASTGRLGDVIVAVKWQPRST